MLIKSIGKFWLKIRPEILLIRACWFPRVKVRIQISRFWKRPKKKSWKSPEKKSWKKLRPVRDLHPWPLRYRCSALPTELTSQIYDFHIFTTVYSPLHRFIWDQHIDRFPVGLLAQVVEHCTGIAGVMGSNSVQAWIFFRPSFHYYLSSVHYCLDRFHSRL